MTIDQLDNNVLQYLATALWLSHDTNDKPLNHQHTVKSFNPQSCEQAHRDVNSFIDTLKRDKVLKSLKFNIYAYDFIDLAHQLWVTRNSIECGFSTPDYSRDVSQRLTEIAREMGKLYIYVNQNNELYFV